MVVVLIRVHRAAEDEHCPVLLQPSRRSPAPHEAPLLQLMASRGHLLAEGTRLSPLAVDQAEDLHTGAPATGTSASTSTRLNVFALVAACATQLPFARLRPLLLKST